MATVRGVAALAMMLALTAARRPPSPPPPPPVVAPVPPTIKTGVEKWRAGDYAAAVAIWTPFATAGDADALFNLGQAYKLGRGVAIDPVAARDYYRKAANKGHLPAQANFGIALFQAGEKAEAIKWLKTAADRGEARAQYVLGIATFNGDGVARSQSLGYAYLLRAQASGLPQAVTALGTIAPGLSPADRAAGETVAASLAAGTGVNLALAATAPSRAIVMAAPVRPPAPAVTPPAASIVPAAIAPTPPPSVAVASPLPSRAGPMVTPAAPGALSVTKPPPLGPRSMPPTLLREPTPAQFAAAARSAFDAPSDQDQEFARPQRPSIATVDIPASRHAVVPIVATRPSAAQSAVRPVEPPAAPARAAADPARKVTSETPRAAAPLATEVAAAPHPLKAFETAATEPAKRPTGWRVQLGAFSSRKLADAAWDDVKATAAPGKPVFATDGPVTKLQVGPFATRDAAKAACAKLTTAGRACFVTQG